MRRLLLYLVLVIISEQVPQLLLAGRQFLGFAHGNREVENRLVGTADGDLFDVIPLFHGETRQEGDPEVLADHRLDDVDVGGAVEDVRPEVGPATHLLKGLVVEELGIGDDKLFTFQARKIHCSLFGQGMIGADDDLEGEAG